MAASGSKKAGRYFTVGESTYAPGDEVPAEVVALVDNDVVWESVEDAETPSSDEPAKSSKK